MNLNLAATIVAVFALIGYFLMLLFAPALNYERLLFLGSLLLIAMFLMFMHRRQSWKKGITT
jgi:hypothetical protein